MKTRPKVFWKLALIMLTIAASFPVQVMMAYGYEASEFGAILTGLAPLNWLVILTAAVHAVMIYHATPWVMISATAFLGAVFWNNWVVALTGLNYSTATAMLASIGAVASHLPLLRGDALRVLTNPKLRWWRTAPRRRASIHAVIRPVLGGELRTHTVDISTGGAFLSLENATSAPNEKVHLRNLKIGTRCTVRLMIDHMHVLNCGAEIVRHSGGMGSYPRGFALRFVCLDDGQRRILANCMNTEAAAARAS